MPNSAYVQIPAETAPNVAWLFPGQGAQEVGMGSELWQSSPAARTIFETADAVLGFSLTSICFHGPEDKLRDTSIAQPAILAVSLAALVAAIESGAVHRRPAFAAGHSLGEYAALVAAGSLSIEDGLRLVQRRGRLMAEAGEANPGTLAAIIGLDEAAVEEACREAGADVCNLNLPNQTVVGGTRAAVEKAMAFAKERGAQRAMELNVSGAFHSRLMRSAVSGLEAYLAGISVLDPEFSVLSNLTGEPLTDAAAIRQELPRQVVSPVRWHHSVATMSAAGVTTFVEFGPGRVLTGMVRRLVPGATLVNVSTFADATQLKL